MRHRIVEWEARDAAGQSCSGVNTFHVDGSAAFINNTMGCEFVTLDIVYNYFIRPRLSNKRIFGAEALIKLSRERAHPVTVCSH